MKYLVIALPVILAACGGSSGNTPLFDAPTAATPTADDNCTTPYFQEIAGVYDGEIRFDSAGFGSCLWDVDFEVVARQNSNTMLNHCETFANITSTLLSENITLESGAVQCGDIAQAGDFFQPISGLATVDELQLEAISFPVEGTMSLNASTPSRVIMPTGMQRATSQITVVFDGRGNLTFPESTVFSGVMVKQ